MKTIALIDTNQGGHHLMYLRLLSQTLLDLGYRAIAFCPDPANLTAWIAANSPQQVQEFHAFPVQEPDLVSLPIVGRLPQPFNVLNRWRHAAITLKKASSQLGYTPDLVFFNWIDSYLSYYLTHHIIDQIFPYPWFGLCFQPRLQFNSSTPNRQGFVDFHAVLNSRRCRGVGVLDEAIATKLQSKITNPVVTFPDLTDESPPDPNFSVVQELLERAKGRKIMGLLGSLNKRKGLLTLIEVAQQSIEENCFFAFVGKLSTYTLLPEELTKIKTVVESAPSNCFFHFEMIPDEPQFNALVNECDILFAAYENFPYSSNIITKAAVFSKPVIVSEGFCMGERVQKFQLGLTIPEGSVTKCLEAIHALCDSKELGSLQLQPNFAEYKRLHSIAQLRTVFKNILANS